MKHSHNNIRFFLLWVLLILTLTGCWSSNEIETLGLSPAVALDVGEESPLEKELKEKGGGYPKKDLFTLTYQYIPPQKAGSGKKTGGSEQKAYRNISETGDALHQQTREIPLRSDRILFGQHLKVIVIGEELARTYRLDQLLDYFLRENEIRLSCLVLISKGRASEMLETMEKGEIPAFRLLGIVDNDSRTTRLLRPMSLAKLIGKIPSGSSFLLQNVVSANGEVKFAGAAVIKGKSKKLSGFLNETELEGLTWLTGKGKGGVLKSFDQKTGQLIMYEIESMKSKITPRVNGEKISFDVKIESEGSLSENWANLGKPTENTFLKREEETVQKEVKQLVNNVIEKMQKEYRVDVAGFGTRLRIEYPKVWERVKKDWDERFSEIPINYDVKITITDYGSSTE